MTYRKLTEDDVFHHHMKEMRGLERKKHIQYENYNSKDTLIVHIGT